MEISIEVLKKFFTKLTDENHIIFLNLSVALLEINFIELADSVLTDHSCSPCDHSFYKCVLLTIGSWKNFGNNL